MNTAATNTKFIGANITFDEGGMGSRHRMNPVRQYNKDKPQKFRVDFFISPTSYIILMYIKERTQQMWAYIELLGSFRQLKKQS
jgi:hypothetical protein